MSSPRLTAAMLVAWYGADVAVGKTKAWLEKAQAKSTEMLERYETRLEPSTAKRDKGKDVKVGKAGNLAVRVTRYKGGRRMSLEAYEEAGHTVTPEMEQHITRPPMVRVTWKLLDGPVAPGAVEPAGGGPA